MLVQLGQHSAQLEHESTVVTRQVDGAFEDLPRWSARLSLNRVALKPVLSLHDLHFLGHLFGVIAEHVATVLVDIVLIDEHSLRLP